MEKKRAVAYCRVSTMKGEQLDSFHMQQQFFREYCQKHPEYELINIYADEGKSGTKMKIRSELLKMLEAAKRKEFEVVLVKDVSRLARNIADFINIIQELQRLKIKVIFVNYNLDSQDGSNFQLNLFALIAQEESGNTSRRIKMSKRMNAEKGRVPNLVYGYDKTPGEYFKLKINEEEADVVRQIFELYTLQGQGEKKISNLLNAQGKKTKRNCMWSQNAVSRILQNPLYTGLVINGKQEVVSFLTGERKNRDQTEWYIVQRQELQIISNDLFKLAQEEREKHQKAFIVSDDGKEKHTRRTGKYIFSQLLKCDCCGRSFMRYKRTYKNTYYRWKCSCRYSEGVNNCDNKTVIDEDELLQHILEYFIGVVKEKKDHLQYFIKEFEKECKAQDENARTESELIAERNKLVKLQEKELDLYRNDLCTLEDLKKRTAAYKDRIETIDRDLDRLQKGLSRSEVLLESAKETLKQISAITVSKKITNEQLRQVIEYISVRRDGKVDIFIKNFQTAFPNEKIQIRDDRT